MTRARMGIKAAQLVMTALLLGYLLRHYHYSLAALEFNAHSAFWLLPCLFIVVALIPLLAGLRWSAMLQSIGVRYPLAALIRINFLSIFWGAFLPSSDGFAVIRAMLLMRKIGRKAAIGSVLLEKYLGVLCLFSIALAASFAVRSLPAVGVLRLILTVAIAALLGVVVLARKLSASSQQSDSLLGKAMIHLRNLANLLLQAQRRHLARGALLVVVIQLTCILNVFFLFHLFGHRVSFVDHLCFVPVIQTISLIPATISGFGVREGAFVLFYQHLGVPPEDLITISLLNFLLLTGVPALIGGVASIFSNVNVATASRKEQQSI